MMAADLPEAWLATEYLRPGRPIIVRRTVRWSECDPAGVVYAGNFVEYLLSAVSLFKRHLLADASSGLPGERAAGDVTYLSPGKAIEIVFQGPLYPDEAFDMSVYVGEVRAHTLDVLVQAVRADDGSAVFMGRVTSIYVAPHDRRQTVPIPDPVRTILGEYTRASPVPERLAAQVSR